MFNTLFLILFLLIIPVEIGKQYIVNNNPTIYHLYKKDTINMNIFDRYIYDLNLIKIILL